MVITDSLGISHTVVTDASGAYTQTVPPGSTKVDVDENDGDMPSGVTLSAGSTDPATVVVPAGGTREVETGYIYDQQVTGVVFIDLDEDGNYEPGDGETPIANISVVITDSAGSIYTVVTDASGAYTQTVPAGNTTVDVDQNDSDMPPGATLSAGSSDPTTVNVPAGGTANVETGYQLPQAGLNISKTRLSSNLVAVGDPVQFEIVVENTGDTVLTTVPLTDTYDTTYLSFSSANPTANDNDDDGQLNWNNIGQIEVGGRVTVTVDFIATASTGPISTTNTAQASATDENGLDVPSGTGDDDVKIINPSIEVKKSVSLAAVAPRQIVTYTLRFTNTGDVLLNPVNVTDTMDVGLTYAGPSDPPLSAQNGQELVWLNVAPGGLVPHESGQITFLAEVTTTIGTYQNFVVVEAEYPTGVVTDTDQVPIGVADPAVEVAKGVVAPGVVDGLITFTIRITNTGPSTLDAVPLFDRFTGPIEYVGGTPLADPDKIDNVNQVLGWSDLTQDAPYGFGQDLDPGEVFIVTTTFRVTANTQNFTVTNTAVVTRAQDTLGNTANDDDDSTILINIPTAIDLLYFEADHQGDYVSLNWATAVEIDNFGFRLLRSTTGQLADAVEIAFVPGQGHGTASGASYTFVDQNVETNQTYTYWLVDVDLTGAETTHGPATVDSSTIDSGGSATIFLPMIFRR